MKFTTALALLVVFATTSTHGLFDAYYKASSDCVSFLDIPESRLDQYNLLTFPPDRETMCFVRCVLLALDLWDDCNGTNWGRLDPRFDSECTKRDIRTCIAHKLAIIEPQDLCSRAYYALRCFRQNIQTVLADADTITALDQPAPIGFIPLKPAQLVKVFASCMTHCNVSVDTFNFCTHQRDDPDVLCVAHCVAVRNGVYTDQDGVLLENLHAQLGQGEPLDAFRWRMERCFRRYRAPAGSCPRQVVCQQYLPCVRTDYERFFASHRELLESLHQFCVFP